MPYAHALGYVAVFLLGAWLVTKLPQLNVIGKVVG